MSTVHYSYQHQDLDGFFGLSHLTELYADGTELKVELYTIIRTGEEEVSLEIDYVPRCIPPHSIFFLSPGQSIRFERLSAKAMVIRFNKAFYCVQLHDAEVSCNGLLFNGVIETPLVRLNDAEQRSFLMLNEVMIEEFSLKDNVQLEMLQALLKRYIIKCTRLAKSQISDEKKVQSGEIDLIKDFSGLVEQHFRVEHSVQYYADRLFKSPKTLSNLFKKYNDKSPLRIIQERIALEAKRLLYYTDKSAKEIAFDLGFDDPAHFSRFFKKEVGQSPSDFKEQQVMARSNTL